MATMEFHEHLDPTRSHDLSWNATSETQALPPDFSLSFEFVQAVSANPFLNVSFTPQYYPIPESYGFATGAQFDPNTFEDYSDTHDRNHLRKRRRVNSGSAMPSSDSPTTPGEKEPAMLYGEMAGQGSTSSWPYPTETSSPGASSSSPLVKRVATMLCPGCPTLPWGQSDEYQPIVNVAPAVYDPDKPYTAEKPLSMHMFSPESYKSATLAPQQQPTYYTDHPSMQVTQIPIFGSAAAQPLLAIDTISLQDGTAALPYQEAKLEADASPDLSPGMGDDLLDSSSLSISYPALQFPVSDSPKLSHVGGNIARSLYEAMLHSASARSATKTTTTRVSDPDVQNRVTQPERKTNFDILPHNQRGGKRGPFRDPSLREQTAQTRRMGSCIRCRMQRIRCEHNVEDPNGQCMTCLRVANSKTGRFPCLRYKITDVKLYKLGQVPGYEWTKRWSSTISDPIQEWASVETRIIQVSEGYSDQVLELCVRQFVPQEGDKLERSWDYMGERKAVKIPPFALVDLEGVKGPINKYMRLSMDQAFTKIVGQKRDGLLCRTYRQTVTHCGASSTPPESKELLMSTFRLWMAIRCSTRSYFIVGEDKLGMPEDILDMTSPDRGRIPMPPVLGAQLDMILIHQIQSQLRRQVLEKLEKMVSKKQLNTWMATYLVTFVLLHNISLITAHDAGYARKHGMKQRFARVDKVKEYHMGANILLAHFHYCNRSIHPFSDDCSDHDLRTLAGLDDGQIRFVHATRWYIKQHSEEWKRIRARGEVEDDYYFVSQLYEDEWFPRTAV